MSETLERNLYLPQVDFLSQDVEHNRRITVEKKKLRWQSCRIVKSQRSRRYPLNFYKILFPPPPPSFLHLLRSINILKENAAKR